MRAANESYALKMNIIVILEFVLKLAIHVWTRTTVQTGIKSYFLFICADPSLFLRRQKPRTVFSSDQLKILEAVFKENNYPDAAKRKDVANVTGLPVDRVRVWFQNRRAKEKRLTEDRLALSLLKNEMRVTERANVSFCCAKIISIIRALHCFRGYTYNFCLIMQHGSYQDQ